MGGTCRMVPVNRGSTASSSARVTLTGRSSSTVPVLSWVSVTSPSRRRASYSFSPRSAKETALVAAPTNTGRTPVAMGSRVPAWPTRFSWRMPRSLAQTSMLVHPAGLSMMTIPFAISSIKTSFSQEFLLLN